jgi:hypothetical protein
MVLCFEYDMMLFSGYNLKICDGIVFFDLGYWNLRIFIIKYSYKPTNASELFLSHIYIFLRIIRFIFTSYSGIDCTYFKLSYTN